MTDKPGIASDDAPLRGVEKKDAACGHSDCCGDVCRLDAAEAAIDDLSRCIDSFARRKPA